jgi:outer membrane protein assembly factor BamB
MDKKTEIALRNRSKALQSAATVKASLAATPSVAVAQTPTGWWMYHGDPEHTGYVSDSNLDAAKVGSSSFTTLFTIPLGGSVLSVPAVADGYIYVGLGNSLQAQGGNGGSLHKIDIQTGNIVNTFNWDLGNDTRDIHSFTGMGSTPAVINGHVYFGAFNGKFYCLDQASLSPVWITDLRNADSDHNQPITNDAGIVTNAGGVDSYNPPAVIWSSPVFNADGTKLYVGCGEGENPELFSFIFCLDTATGNVNWIYCTNKYLDNQDNQPNVLPAPAIGVATLPPLFTATDTPPIVMGSSVWGAIAYDKNLNRIYCPTGNQQPEPNANWNWDGTTQPPPPFNPELPSPGYSNGVLSLDADAGEFKAFFQVPHYSNYRPSDGDIDLGGAPVIFELNNRKVVGIACKNGGFFVLDADTLELLSWRQLLPYHNDSAKSRIETVDAHPNPADGTINPHITNELSDLIPNENYSGVFNTGAVYPGSNDNPQTISPRIFFGMGGPNYHSQSPGIDYNSTPFMRAVDIGSASLADAWPLDNGDPQKYLNTSRSDPTTGQTVGMYASAGEAGLSSPAVVNDVVFCTTSKVSIYAFNVRDGSLLWDDDLGSQTDGYNGGYGYCLGPAVWKNYVVAGALVFGRDGGVLRIYGLSTSSPG